MPPKIRLNVTTKVTGRINIKYKPEEKTILNHIKNLSKEQFENILEELSHAYYYDEALISDGMFDEVKRRYEAKFGEYNIVGAEPDDGESIDQTLQSLGKILEQKQLDKFLKKYPNTKIIVMDKVDGCSVFAKHGQNLRLYSRGGGKSNKVQNLQKMIGYVDLPEIEEDLNVRMEMVFHKADKDKVVTAHRKTLLGSVNSMTTCKESFDPERAKYLHFYAFHIHNQVNKPSEQIEILREAGYQLPNPIVWDKELTVEALAEYYEQRKLDADYEMDGLVLYADVEEEYPEDKNPSHVIAFKSITVRFETKVLEVVWEGSKDLLLKPTVIYEPFIYNDRSHQRASGFNARFIDEQGIGSNAIIELSVNITPKLIRSIIQVEPDFPDPEIHGHYNWNENEVEFVLEEENDDVRVNRLVYFTKTLDIKGLGPGRAKTLVNAGIEDIDGLLAMTEADFRSLDKFGDKLASSVFLDLHSKIQNVVLAKLMKASGYFSKIGLSRFEDILAIYPDLLGYCYEPEDQLTNMLCEINGIGIKLAKVIVSNLANFVEWLNKHPEISYQEIVGAVEIEEHPLTGKNVVFTGFTDSQVEAQMKMFGATVSKTITKKKVVDLLVIKEMSEKFKRGKYQEALELAIPIMSRDEFMETYGF